MDFKLNLWQAYLFGKTIANGRFFFFIIQLSWMIKINYNKPVSSFGIKRVKAFCVANICPLWVGNQIAVPFFNSRKCGVHTRHTWLRAISIKAVFFRYCPEHICRGGTHSPLLYKFCFYFRVTFWEFTSALDVLRLVSFSCYLQSPFSSPSGRVVQNSLLLWYIY